MKLFLRTLVAWFLITCVESLHGVLRTMFLVPRVGDFPSRQIGVFTGSALILFTAYLLVGWLQARTGNHLLVAGIIWLALTISFELGFGHYVFGRSWQDLGEDYNLARGGLMPLGLAVLTVAPSVAARMRNSSSYFARSRVGHRHA